MPRLLTGRGMRLLGLLCLLSLPYKGVYAEPWQVLTEENPPWSFTQAGQLQGFAPALIEAMTASLGDSAQLRALPWARAFKQAQQQPGALLLITIRTPSRERLFKWVGPVVKVNVGFYTLKGQRVTINDDADLAKLPGIGSIRAWFSYSEMRAMGLDNLVPVRQADQLLQLLEHGRVPVVAADDFIIHASSNVGIRHDDLELIYPFRQVYGYIAINAQTPDEDVQRLQQALDGLKASGEFSRLYRQWLPAPSSEALASLGARP